MLGLTSGELFVVVFIAVAVIAAPWMPRLGGALGGLFERGQPKPPPPNEP